MTSHSGSYTLNPELTRLIVSMFPCPLPLLGTKFQAYSEVGRPRPSLILIETKMTLTVNGLTR